MNSGTLIMLFVVAVIAIGVGFAVAIFLGKKKESLNAHAGENAVKMLEDAKKESETIIREAAIQAKDVVYQAKAEFEKESIEKKHELQALEKRVQQKEENLVGRADGDISKGQVQSRCLFQPHSLFPIRC